MPLSESFVGSPQPDLFGLGRASAEDGKEKVAVFLILGPPGSGKGTQAALLSGRTGLPHVSTGDILRDRTMRNDDFGKAIAQRIDFGHFVPDEWINCLIDERLAMTDCRNGVILDGYPRTAAQAERLLHSTYCANSRLFVVHLLANAIDLANRFAGRRQCNRCGTLFHLEFQPSLAGTQCDRPACTGVLIPRPDDRIEFLEGRLADYHRLTAPAQAFLSAHCECVVALAASDGSPDAIHQQLWKGLMGIDDSSGKRHE